MVQKTVFAFLVFGIPPAIGFYLLGGQGVILGLVLSFGMSVIFWFISRKRRLPEGTHERIEVEPDEGGDPALDITMDPKNGVTKLAVRRDKTGVERARDILDSLGPLATREMMQEARELIDALAKQGFTTDEIKEVVLASIGKKNEDVRQTQAAKHVATYRRHRGVDDAWSDGTAVRGFRVGRRGYRED